LLLKAGDLTAAVLDLKLLRASQGFLFGKRFGGFGQGDFGFGAGGLGGGDAARSFGKFFAEAAEFEVLGLEDDEVFEVGVHKAEDRV
jgi:hypothetical protein